MAQRRIREFHDSWWGTICEVVVPAVTGTGTAIWYGPWTGAAVAVGSFIVLLAGVALIPILIGSPQANARRLGIFVSALLCFATLVFEAGYERGGYTTKGLAAEIEAKETLESPDGPIVIFSVAVRNTAKPTVAESWQLKLKSGTEPIGPTALPVGPIKSQDKQGKFLAEYPPSGSLQAQTIDPIPNNDTVRGWIAFRLKGRTFAEAYSLAASDYTLTFQDARQREYVAKGMSGEIEVPCGDIGFPGLNRTFTRVPGETGSSAAGVQ